MKLDIITYSRVHWKINSEIMSELLKKKRKKIVLPLYVQKVVFMYQVLIMNYDSFLHPFIKIPTIPLI